MSGSGKKSIVPPLCPANRGLGVEGKLELTQGNHTWVEEINLVNVVEEVLAKHGHSVTKEKTCLVHADSGYTLSPQLVDVQLLKKGGMRTVTSIQMNHPRLCPAGVFEYQHSTGDTVPDTIANGIDLWVQTDFVPLLDATRPNPETCATMVMRFSAKEGKPQRIRRAILGPVAHSREIAPRQQGNEEHPFCQCCLLTNSFEAFRDLLEEDGFYCLRLFAARDFEQNAQADCRVNGEDWEKGAEALRQYVRTWPDAGYEFRKQYVVLQSVEEVPEPSMQE